MYYYELTSDLAVNKVDVSEGDPRLLKPEVQEFKIVFEDSYQFCRLLSKTAYPFLPDGIAEKPSYTSFIEDFYGTVVPFSSSFQKKCIDKKPSEERVLRLYELQDKYPNEWIVKTYSKDYEKWQTACDKTAQKLCEQSYVIKDQVILTYETVGCKLRDVTKEDVEQDIQLMDSNAEKLRHSTLLGSIDICQRAYDSGFYWGYQKPKLSEKCKTDGVQKRKK